tara:strand:+ start:112 stop:333 length:222 start_codon:yes stop_codon:yes gene_type:complete
MDILKENKLTLTKRRPSIKQDISIQITDIENEVNNYINSDLYKAPKSTKYSGESPEIKHIVVERDEDMSLLSI